jgi:hypothetical protein
VSFYIFFILDRHAWLAAFASIATMVKADRTFARTEAVLGSAIATCPNSLCCAVPASYMSAYTAPRFVEPITR